MNPDVVGAPGLGFPISGALGDGAPVISGGVRSRHWRGRGGPRSTGRRAKRGSKRVQRTNGRRTKGRRPKVHKSRRRR